MAIQKRFLALLNEPSGLQYGLRIFLGTCILWSLSRLLGGVNPLWAIISLIIVTEINMETTWLSFKSRIINTLIGCMTGVVFLLVLRHNIFTLPLALATAVCASAYLIRIPYGWRIAAITTAIIIIPSLAESSRMVGVAVAIERTVEVFLGSATAVFVTAILTFMRKRVYG